MTQRRDDEHVDLEKLAEAKIVVAGVGAVGRQVVLGLAAMGAENVLMCDPDTVEEANLRTQGWCPHHIGTFKTHALMAELAFSPVADVPARALLGDVEGNWPVAKLPTEGWISVAMRLAGGSLEGKEVVLCCVDTMQARKEIFEWSMVKGVKLFVDGRAAGEAVRVVTATRRTADSYRESLFEDEEAYRPAGRCTTPMTFYTGMATAAAMLSVLSRWLRGHEVEGNMIMAVGTGESEMEDWRWKP